MIAHVYLAKGAVVPKHAHHNEQLTYILEGVLRFRLGDDESQVIDVHAGEVLTIPRTSHTRRKRSRTRSMSMFSPPREDWLDGSDAYLRR